MPRDIIREYTGSDLLKVPEDVFIPLVENIVHKGDLVMLAGRYKANKSTFTMQLAVSISSATPFLGKFRVPKPEIVWYLSTEGKDNEIRERLIRMNRAVPVDTKRLKLFCSTQLKINTPLGLAEIYKILNRTPKNELPAIIIIDSVYSGFAGTLSSDEVVNEYITNLRKISEYCNDATIWLAHHLKKSSKDETGKEITQTEDDAYGSVFFLGQADHVFTIERHHKDKMKRVVKCNTQRSNKIIEQFSMRLYEPDPFYLAVEDLHQKEYEDILGALITTREGLTASGIIKATGIKTSLAYELLLEMQEKGLIAKDGSYNGKYQALVASAEEARNPKAPAFPI